MEENKMTMVNIDDEIYKKISSIIDSKKYKYDYANIKNFVDKNLSMILESNFKDEKIEEEKEHTENIEKPAE